MMKLLNTRAVFTCSHGPSRAQAGPHTQGFVRIDGAHVLVGVDPAGLGVTGCPLPPPNSSPCSLTLPPVFGHSSWIFIQGVPVCLDQITGPTISVPPGTYSVDDPGQSLVSETAAAP